jgi:MFS family permease
MMVALIGFSRFLIAYPVGRITDTYGRKPGIMLGLMLALVGTIVTGVAMLIRSFALLALGMLIFASGMNAAQQLRVGATDMFPSHHRAQALGYVALGSLVGLVLSPAIMAMSERLSASTGQDPLALPWLFLPGLIIPGLFMVLLVRPDPKEIGMNLATYYPGYKAAERSSTSAGSFGIGAMLRHEPIRLAIVSNCAAQGNMTIVMVLTSLVLSHHGYSLTAIATSHVFHTCGMFAFTIPLGRLADRLGHEKVMCPAVAVALIGAALVALTPFYWSVTLGTFLVGLGWAGANVAATALIADRYESYERGRAIGVNESIGGGATMTMALLTGPLIEWGGLPATGLTAVLITLPPLVMYLGSGKRNAARSSV